MVNWFKDNKKSLIRGSFLIPIILVMIISISHVVSWYDLSNPVSWAIYLSIAVEIAAMSSIAAASVKIRGGAWFVFIIVTLIQFIGNIFFSYKEIDVTSQPFKDWVELTSPVFDALGSDVKDIVSQRRWLAILGGGLLPIISLASLHFFIKYGGMDDEVVVNQDPKIDPPQPERSLPLVEPTVTVELQVDQPTVEQPSDVTSEVEQIIEEEVQEPLIDEVVEEPQEETIIQEVIEEPITIVEEEPIVEVQEELPTPIEEPQVVVEPTIVEETPIVKEPESVNIFTHTEPIKKSVGPVRRMGITRIK